MSSAPPTEPFPPEAQLTEAASFQVFSSDGKSHAFSSLYDDVDTSLIVFIRHFYCGSCQDYIRALTSSISPSSLSTSKRLVIIGCGEPTVIGPYATETACPFPIYTDRTGKLYDILGMGKSLAAGEKPAYIKTSIFSAIVGSIGQGLKWGAPLQGGDIQRIGGEWLWVKGKLAWCHRMKNTRDHHEVPVIKTLLGLEQGHATE